MRSIGRFLLACVLASITGAAAPRLAAAPHGAVAQNRAAALSAEGMIERPSASGPFILHYPDRIAPLAKEIDRLLGDRAEGIAAEIGLEEIPKIHIYLAPDETSYHLLHGGRLPSWAAAFSIPSRRILVINTASVLRSRTSLEGVLRHELSHLFLAVRVGSAPMPAWFMEGLAMVQSGAWSFSDEWALIVLASRGELPYLESLAVPFPESEERAAAAYALSRLAVSELLRERPGVLPTLTAFIRDSRDFEQAFRTTFGETTYDFGSRLYVLIHRKYRTPAIVLQTLPYWTVVALLTVAVWFVKRRRARRVLEEWERQGGDSGAGDE